MFLLTSLNEASLSRVYLRHHIRRLQVCWEREIYSPSPPGAGGPLLMLHLDMETATERTHGRLNEHDCANRNEWKVLGVHGEGML